MSHEIHDDKYIVFPRDEFYRQTTGLPGATPLGSRRAETHVLSVWKRIEIPDAVVIRRQDKIASPALATYASMIAIAASLTEDEEKRKGLLKVADYFEQQAMAAADEGFKLPD